MLDLNLLTFILSLILAVIAWIIGIYIGLKRYHTLYILPKALRLYLLVNCIPFIIYIILISIYIPAFYFIYASLDFMIIEIVRAIISFSSQQIRLCLFTIVFERIIATIKLEKYTLASSVWLFWGLTLYSFSISIGITGMVFYSRIVPDKLYLYDLYNYLTWLTHLLTLGICPILHFLNRKMYKQSAYRITLKRRQKIVENIKVINYLFPIILIYMVLAQFGFLANVITQLLGYPAPPLVTYHIFYNISFLFIYLRLFLIECSYKNANKVDEVKVIKNPFGRNIPATVTTDKYFQNLQILWK